MNDINSQWKIYNIKKVFFGNHFSWSLAPQFHPLIGFIQPLNNLLNSYLFIDLISLLDVALIERIQEKQLSAGRDLNNRLQILNNATELMEYTTLDSYRIKRNSIAHYFNQIEETYLREAIEKIETQLFAWNYITKIPLGKYISFTTSDSEWKDISIGNAKIYEKTGSFGVQIAETGKPVYSISFTARKNDLLSEYSDIAFSAPVEDVS